MKSTKYLFITLFAGIILFLIPSISNAAVEYTRVITGNDGSITINLTGLNLDTTKENEFALVLSGGTPTTWHKITDCTSTTAKIELNSSVTDILAVLKVSDKGYLYIREKDNTGEYKLNNLEIDLKLPYLDAANVSNGTEYLTVKGIYYDIGSGSGYGKAVFKFEKITDESVIQKYLEYKNEGKEISAKDLKQDVPTSGFSSNWYSYYSYYKLSKSNCPSDGLYYLWIQTSADNCKSIYGYYLHDGLPSATTVSQYTQGEGPKVTSIKVVSPNSGTYKTGQTVKIRVYFNKKITGTTVPTLKIKFGDSATRSVTNGTIHNDTNVSTTGQYIEYSYNIQSGDNGQLATVSLTGGTIKDTDGNDAVLSCPVLTGSITIKANTEGTVTNNTENQDKTTNKTSNNSSNSSTSNSSNSSTTNNANKVDNTIAKGKIPYTGASYAVIFAIAIALIAGIIAKVKYNNLKDIK